MLFFEYTFFKHCSFPKTIRSYITASGSFHIHTPHLTPVTFFSDFPSTSIKKTMIFESQLYDVLYGINQVIHYHQHEDKIQ